jgi:hypothetical protein
MVDPGRIKGDIFCNATEKPGSRGFRSIKSPVFSMEADDERCDCKFYFKNNTNIPDIPNKYVLNVFLTISKKRIAGAFLCLFGT